MPKLLPGMPASYQAQLHVRLQPREAQVVAQVQGPLPLPETWSELLALQAFGEWTGG